MRIPNDQTPWNAYTYVLCDRNTEKKSVKLSVCECVSSIYERISFDMNGTNGHRRVNVVADAAVVAYYVNILMMVKWRER